MSRMIKTLFMTGAAVAVTAFFAGAVSAASDVAVNETNFPDQAFRAEVSLQYDKDKDGKLSSQEIKDVTVVNMKSKNIYSLKGIKFFTEATQLDCSGNHIARLDLSKNTKLILAVCDKNGMTDLTIGRNDDLMWFSAKENQIGSIDTSGCPKLKMLALYSNPLKTLDISKNECLIKAYKYGEKKTGEKDDKGLVFTSYKLKQISGGNISKLTEYYTLLVDEDTKINAGSSDVPVSQGTIDLTSKTASVVCGSDLYLQVKYSGLQDGISWKSSDPKVATVTGGAVVGKRAGKAVITVSSGDVSASCEVTVLYKDVADKKDFWYKPVNNMTALGIVKGYDKQTKFKPANKCTRAQMVTFIWRLEGSPKPKSKTCKFKDVKKSDYFYEACIWGNENHIVEGYKDGTFGPQITCARKHAVTFLWRLAGAGSMKGKKCKFKDVKKSDYYYEPVIWASENGILEGYKDGTFRPNGDCLRRQMVTFLDRYNEKMTPVELSVICRNFHTNIG